MSLLQYDELGHYGGTMDGVGVPTSWLPQHLVHPPRLLDHPPRDLDHPPRDLDHPPQHYGPPQSLLQPGGLGGAVHDALRRDKDQIYGCGETPHDLNNTRILP
ncbi:unnamed protein product [Merluccius merluccius]